MAQEAKMRIGAVYRIKLHNFLTFSDVEIFPGPRLNFILGPNGTGKSSIVCALCLGLAGSTNSIMRAESVGDYVKTGEADGYTEIELYKGHPDKKKNITVRRNITKQNTTIWTIDGKRSSMKEVRNLTTRLNIQVNNLTVFLAQDRVSSFAKMSPTELLLETQKAASPKLAEAHQTLIDLQKTNTENQARVTKSREQLVYYQAREDELKVELERYNEFFKLEKKIADLKFKRPWAEYFAESIKRKTAQEYYDAKLAEYEEVQAKLQPLVDAIKLMERDEAKKIAEQKHAKDALKVFDKKRVKIMNSFEDFDDKNTALQEELEEVTVEFENRAKNIHKKQKQMVKVKESLSQLRDMQEVADELKDATKLLNSVALRQRQCIRQMEELKEGSQQTKRNLQKLLKQREKAVKNSAMTKTNICRHDRSSRVMAAFVDKMYNENKMKGEIHGPLLSSVDVKDDAYAGMLEKRIPAALRTAFVVTDERDFRLLNQFRQQHQLRNTIIQSDISQADRVQHNPQFRNLDIQKLKSLGLHCFMNETYTAPPAVTQVLNDHALDCVGVWMGPAKDEVAAANSLTAKEQGDGLCHQLFSPRQSFFIKFSRYDVKDISTSVNPVPDPRFLHTGGSASNENLDSQIAELQGRLAKMEAEYKVKKEEGNKYNTKPLETKKAQFKEEQAKHRALNQKAREIKQQLEDLQEDDRGVDEIKDGLLQQIEKNTSKMTTLMGDLADHLELWDDLVKTDTTLEVDVRIVRARRHNAEDALHLEEQAIDDLRNAVENAQMELKYVTDNCRKLKKHAKRASPRSPEVDAMFQEEWMPNSPEEIDMKILEYESRAKSVIPDRTIKERYDKAVNEVQSLTQTLRNTEILLGRNLQDFKNQKDTWVNEVQDMVDKIHAQFAECFKRMRCEGKVVLQGDAEDFAAYRLEIYTKYRQDANGMKLLSSHSQSGGERSVATMLYLLCLQNVTECPFRVVDEINQGMDPQNERMIFSQIVESAESNPASSTCQYFLLTPKLLPNLKYSVAGKDPSITVLFIFNGPYSMPQADFNMTNLIKKCKDLKRGREERRGQGAQPGARKVQRVK